MAGKVVMIGLDAGSLDLIESSLSFLPNLERQRRCQRPVRDPAPPAAAEAATGPAPFASNGHVPRHTARLGK